MKVCGLLVVLTVWQSCAQSSPTEGREESKCANNDSRCILDQLRENGLINQKQYERNLYFLNKQRPRASTRSDVLEYTTEHPVHPTIPTRDNQRYRYNSKYNPDCWDEAPPPREGSPPLPRRLSGRGGHRGTLSSSRLEGRRSSSGRGGGRRAPCLWETSYYQENPGTI